MEGECGTPYVMMQNELKAMYEENRELKSQLSKLKNRVDTLKYTNNLLYELNKQLKGK